MARTTKPKATPETAESGQPVALDPAANAEISVEDAPVIDDAAKRQASGRGGQIVTVALAAIVSAGVGFAVSYVTRPAAPDTSAQDAVIADLSKTDADLAARVDALENTPPPTIPPPLDLAPLEQRLSRMEQLAAKLGDLDGESLSGDSLALLAMLRAEVIRLRDEQKSLTDQMAALESDISARLDQMDQAARATRDDIAQTSRELLRKAAIARLRAALESGAPFMDVRAELPDLPPPLADFAETGIPSLAMLTEQFAPAARLALADSLRATEGEGWLERLGTFLRVTTGARSLTPREGDDPDAVISRAEAALATGDLAAALTELSKLPAEGQTQMADWVGMANRRLAAFDALADLAAE